MSILSAKLSGSAMQTSYKPGMLLFSKEIQAYPKYRILYFVEQDTLSSESPVLHRFIIRRADFDRYVYGSVYDLQVRSNRIVGALMVRENALKPEHYLPLIERRDLQFMPLSEARKRRRKGENFFDPDDYYSYDETRELIEYGASWAENLLSWLIFVALRGLALLIPAALYLYTVYKRIDSLSYGASNVGQILAVPVYALSAAVFMIFLMMALEIAVEALTLRMNVTRWFLLKRAVLVNSGRRVSINPSPARIKKLIAFGIVSMLLLLAMLLIFMANGI